MGSWRYKFHRVSTSRNSLVLLLRLIGNQTIVGQGSGEGGKFCRKNGKPDKSDRVRPRCKTILEKSLPDQGNKSTGDNYKRVPAERELVRILCQRAISCRKVENSEEHGTSDAICPDLSLMGPIWLFAALVGFHVHDEQQMNDAICQVSRRPVHSHMSLSRVFSAVRLSVVDKYSDGRVGGKGDGCHH